jgi:hypothetical protein
MFFSALALFLMVADMRFKVTQPIRAAFATALYPVQWLALQPVRAAQYGGGYFTALNEAKAGEEAARQKLAVQSVRAGQVEQLTLENTRLRKLLDLRNKRPSMAWRRRCCMTRPIPIPARSSSTKAWFTASNLRRRWWTSLAFWARSPACIRWSVKSHW